MQHKGAQYSKIFRKAGLAWGKGNLQKAVVILEEGITVAEANGDTEVAHMLRQDVERYRQAASGAEIDFSA